MWRCAMRASTTASALPSASATRRTPSSTSGASRVRQPSARRNATRNRKGAMKGRHRPACCHRPVPYGGRWHSVRFEAAVCSMQNFDANFWYLAGGIPELLGFGDTVLFGEYSRACCGTAVSSLQLAYTGSKATVWGLGVVQYIDAAAMEVFLTYKSYSVDRHTDRPLSHRRLPDRHRRRARQLLISAHHKTLRKGRLRAAFLILGHILPRRCRHVWRFDNSSTCISSVGAVERGNALVCGRGSRHF